MQSIRADNGAVPRLELDRICKSFGPIVAVRNVSFKVHRGEVVALLGDNGAGKSTIVKMIAGVHRPDSGTITLDGELVRHNSARRARDSGVETVYQDLALVEMMSISRNFYLGAEPRKWGLLDRRTMEHGTREALERIGLGNLRHVGQTVQSLSGGERQAISIGRAIAFGRKLLILDEPTSALSVKETGKVFEYIRRASGQGLGLIVVMHNLAQAREVANRFVFVEHGRVIADLENVGQAESDLASLISGSR